MNFVSQAARLLAILGTLMLVSCIDGREEYWLNADGSGRADITYSLPEAAAKLYGGQAGVEKVIVGFLAEISTIKTSSLTVTTRDGRLTVHLLATFDSALEMAEIAKDGSLERLPPAALGLSGLIDVNIHGRTVAFSRVIDAGKSLPGSFLMPDSRFEGHNLAYIIHLPLAATRTNAANVGNNGRTLEWNFPMSQAIRGPVTLRFEAPVPIPAWVWAAVILTVCTFVILGVIAFRKFGCRKQTDNGRPARRPSPLP